MRNLLPIFLSLFTFICIGCSTFVKPIPLDKIPFKERAITRSRDNLSVTVAALSDKESKKAFGVDIANQNIQPVWIGQISRDIGVKLTLKTGFLVTHVIDSDVDNDRYYLIQNLVDAKALVKLGFVKGAEVSSPDTPLENLGGDPYITDGLRAVMVCSEIPISFTEADLFHWELPPSVEEYRSEIFKAQTGR